MSKKDFAHDTDNLMHGAAELLTHFNEIVRKRELCPECFVGTLVEAFLMLQKEGVLKGRTEYSEEEKKTSPFFVQGPPVQAIRVGKTVGNA